MWTLVNCLMLLFAFTNLYGLAVGKGVKVRDIAAQLRSHPNGRSHLQTALVMSAAAQIYFIALTFPLKAFHYHLGLAWAVLMLVSVLESIYTGRTLVAAVEAKGELALPLHDSRWYQAYQVAYNLAIVGACVLLIWLPLRD